MKKLLYIIRTEADFERVVCLAISGKGNFKQYFVFAGDFSPFYDDGIQNQFQKKLFKKYDFNAIDLCDFSFMGRILKRFTGSRSISLQQFQDQKSLFIPWLFNMFLRRYTISNKMKLVKKALEMINPNILFTDQSITDSDYIPEIFRNDALKKDIPVYVFTHGAAGGLHSFFSEQIFDDYKGCTVLACSKYENKSHAENRKIIGDMSSSYPYVHFINQQEISDIHFMNDKKYKVGFMVGGTGPLTTTTGWHVMEEIIIDLSEKENVAMVLKMHPREAPFIDLRLLNTFTNLLIVCRETDRSRITKWANILVCGDHCSTIFEPMVLGKKVVAISGRHIPKYKNMHSPLKKSSVLHISSANEFDLINIPNADQEDPVTNAVAWGGHGKVDLAEKCFGIMNSLAKA